MSSAVRQEFARLHEAGCFVIPNPWDAGSAKALAGLGFALVVLAMSSFYTVPETKQAVVLRLGKPERIVNEYDPKAKLGETGVLLAA